MLAAGMTEESVRKMERADAAAFRATLRQKKREVTLFRPDDIPSVRGETFIGDEMSGVLDEIYAMDWTQCIESRSAYVAAMSLAPKDRKILDLYFADWPEADIAACFRGADIYYRLKHSLEKIRAAYAAEGLTCMKDTGGKDET